MTDQLERPTQAAPSAKPRATIIDWLTTTDHKRIGVMYLVASGLFFAVGGIMALLIRLQLTAPGLSLMTPEAYNQLFTMHGSIMLLLYAMPFFTGIANVIMPVQIGAPDVAFPRLNAFSFWLFLFGGLIVAGGLLTPQGAASFGWTAYFPLASTTFSPSLGASLWFSGVGLMGFGTILAAVNFITTIITMRAPGMTMFRMSIFTWNTLVTSILILVAFPVLAAAVFAALADRVFGAHIYDAATGGPLVWQHLFWFWGHPEVYIIVLPFFGIVSEIMPVFSRKPMFGYKTLIYATISIAALSITVWAHHMYVTGSVLLPFFSLMTMLIAVPTGVKIFNWIGTMWRGSVTFETPMLFVLGFLVNFIFGGLTGVILSSPVLDFHISDTYFVVAHFHYVLVGAVVFVSFAAVHFWWPKMTGKMLNETLGKITFWLLFVGFNTTFLVQHWLGVSGMPRRYYSYLPSDNVTWMNEVASIGSAIMSLAMLPFILNIWVTWRRGVRVNTPDPWGFGRSLEWATPSPIPRHNFLSIPRIRSESPAFDLHHPEAAAPEARQHEPGVYPRRMTARVANISIHAENPGDLARFWCAVMGYPAWTSWPDDEVAELRASGMTDDELAERAEAWDQNPAHQRFYFSRYRRERRQRNRMHIDITPFDDRRATKAELLAESERLVALGASVEKVLDGPWGPYDEFAIMMRDPEGNEFCLQ